MKKFLMIFVMLCLAICLFTACNETETPDPTIAPTATAAPEETPLPKVELEYDHTKFVMDGYTLVAYIGNEETVEIPNDTIEIGDKAFYGCKTVKAITFKDTVKTIGDYAFYGCTSLESVAVPKLVKEIGEYAFAECTGLKTFETKTSTTIIGKGMLKNCGNLEKVTLSNSLVEVPSEMMYGCAKVTEVKIPAATTFGDKAFYGCTALTKVDATAVAKIGKECFKDCAAFENGGFSSSVTELGENAFVGTKWLSESIAKANNPTKESENYVYIGKGILVYYSGKNATDTTTIKFESKVKDIAAHAFDDIKDGIVTLEIPNTVIRIEDGAFAGFTSLKTVKIASSLTAISNSAFEGCTKLETVTWATKIATIGDKAFLGCKSLVTLSTDEKKTTEGEGITEVKNIMPTSLTSIGEKAFKDCAQLANIEFGKELLTIGAEAFYGCTEVGDVTFGKKLSTVGLNAFVGTTWFDNWDGDETTNLLIVGDGVLLKAVDFDYKNFPDEAKSISVVFTGISSFDEKQFYANTKLYAVEIPGTVTKIADYAFYYAENLTSVVINSGCKEIGNSAFYGCKNLVNVVIPETVEKIGDYAFYGCSDLTEIKIPSKTTSIGKFAFYNCLKLATVDSLSQVKTLGEYALTNTAWMDIQFDKYVVVGDGFLVKYNAYETETDASSITTFNTIVGGAFDGTYRLEKITFSSTVKTIGNFGFSGCTTVKEIIATGVTTVGENAFNECSSLVTKKLG